MINRYSKPTMDLIIELLQRANQLNIDVDKVLEELSESALQELIEELQKLEKDGKIDLSEKVNLRNNPALQAVLIDIEKRINQKINDWLGFGQYALESHLTSVYKDTTNTTYNIFINAGISPQFTERARAAYTQSQIQITDTYITNNVLPVPWLKDGKTYSQRLYNNVANFEAKLAFVLEEGLTKGKGTEWMIKSWRKLTGSAAYEAARLIKTETVAYWTQATKQAYLNMGITYVEIVGDANCGTICLEYVGSTPVPLADAEAGGLLPPYHPNCACSFIAYIDAAETDDIYEVDYFD